MPGPVLLDLEDGVARLRLNRPEASNAINRELLEALVKAVGSLQRDRSVRAVVLSGEGENFCAGGDVRASIRRRAEIRPARANRADVATRAEVLALSAQDDGADRAVSLQRADA